MLTLSRIDAAEGKLSDAKVSINEVIDNSIFIMKPALEKSRITVNFTAEKDFFVAGDSGQLNQIFINLLGNAIKFSPDGSQICIALDESKSDAGDQFVRVTLTDQGIGIPAEDIDHLFTRFFRAKNADSGQYPGTGLGLSIVQQVVNRHNGLIHVTSEIGKGTTFIIEIPAYISNEDQIIQARRGDVLARAIIAIEKSTPENIKAVTHEMGGAIGFYGFEDEGRAIVEYSRSLDADPVPLNQFPADKTRILDILYSADNRIKREHNE
jgi:two-component sensor histidine kinase